MPRQIANLERTVERVESPSVRKYRGLALPLCHPFVLNPPNMLRYAADLNAVREASERIAPHAHRTAVLTCATLDALTGLQLFFKCENFQKVGAFKFRGACNAVLRLSDDTAARGVVTHSSGNHAQALALAASLRNIQAHIVMPTSAMSVKRRAVEGYGATVYPCEPTLAAREEVAARVIEQTGAVLIPSYDHPDIIAGQGTVGLELMDEVPDLDAIIVPLGGGGLISGVCIAAKALNPTVSIFAAEPAGADDAARSMAAGRLIPQTNPNTIADGLLTSLGEHTWPIIRDHVERVITVPDDKIIEAMRLVWERMKIIIEPSAAVAVAAVLQQDCRLSISDCRLGGGDDRQSTIDNRKSEIGNAKVGVVLSGGNVDLTQLPW